jgi:hypothetical protein
LMFIAEVKDGYFCIQIPAWSNFAKQVSLLKLPQIHIQSQICFPHHQDLW